MERRRQRKRAASQALTSSVILRNGAVSKQLFCTCVLRSQQRLCDVRVACELPAVHGELHSEGLAQ